MVIFKKKTPDKAEQELQKIEERLFKFIHEIARPFDDYLEKILENNVDLSDADKGNIRKIRDVLENYERLITKASEDIQNVDLLVKIRRELQLIREMIHDEQLLIAKSSDKSAARILVNRCRKECDVLLQTLEIIIRSQNVN